MPDSAIDPVREPLLDLIESDGLPRTSPHDCSYLPDRQAQSEGFTIASLHGETYHDLMDMGFRRSGKVVYRPRCEGCQACVPLRVPVATFKPTHSQRRTLKRNADLTIAVSEPLLTDEKIALYQRYLTHQHPQSPQSGDADGLREFLYESIVDTLEVNYIKDGRIVAVSILDLCSRSVSTVYHFFDPGEAKRSLGVFSVLTEIDIAKQRQIPYYYMGYWIQGCATMQYKANYQPHEILIDGRWKWVDSVSLKMSPADET